MSPLTPERLAAQEVALADLETLRPTMVRVSRLARALFNSYAADCHFFIDGTIFRASGAERDTARTDPAGELVAEMGAPMWVEDLSLDHRFSRHSAVADGENLRFFAGAPIVTADTRYSGVIAVYGTTPQAYDSRMERRLEDLAAIVAQDFQRVRAVRERAEAIQRIQRSEDRLRLAMQSSGLHVYEMDYKSKVLFKGGAEDTFFDSPKTFADLLTNIWGPVHPEDLPAAKAEWDRCQQTGEPFRVEYRLMRNDGSYVWAQSSAALIEDDRGHPSRLIGALLNISEHKRREAELEAARAAATAAAERLAFALEAGRSAAWEITYPKLKVKGIEEVEALMGVPINEGPFWTSIDRIMPPQEAAAFRQFFADLRTNERADFEGRHVQPNGGTLWLRTSGKRIPDPSDPSRGRIVLLTTDVTSRKEAEIAFAEAMRAAAAALAGKRQLIRSISDDLGDDALSESLDAGGDALDAEETSQSFQELYRRLASLLHEIESRDAVLGRAVEVLRSARASAEEANRAKSRFLATMSHELRTPLNAVMGYAEILDEELSAAGRENDADDARRIRRAARTLLTLINQVLDLSKIDAGGLSLVPTETDIGALLAEVVEACEQQFPGHGNTVSVVMPSDLTVEIDTQRLRTCLHSLISNACKFTQHGRVRIDVEVVEQAGELKLLFRVADTGCGVRPEDQSKLFEPFSQVDGSQTRKHDGSGLGLVLAKRIAELLGGGIAFESAPGAGSTFELSVAARPVGAGHLDTPVSASGPSVLVVEDDPEALDLYRRFLARLPIKLFFARTGGEGEDLIREIGPALVLLDIGLPDMSGWDLLDRLRAAPSTADIPVVICSIEDDRAKALARGAVEAVGKPIERERLVQTVTRYALSGPAAPQRLLA